MTIEPNPELAALYRNTKPASGSEEFRALRQVEVLEPLSDKDIEKLQERLPTLSIRSGDLIFTPAHRVNLTFFVLDGSFRIYKACEGWEVTLQILHSGGMLSNGVFGEGPLGSEDQIRFAIYCQAMKDSKVAMIQHHHFERLVEEHPKVGIKALEILGRNVALYGQRIADMASKDVPARLARLIIELVETEGVVERSGYKLPTCYTHEDLAKMVGCRRVALTRALSELKSSGVHTRGRRIHVKDLQTLE